MNEKPEDDFKSAQRLFSSYLRDPDNKPKPSNLNETRLSVYRNAVFANIEGFLSDNFPRVREFYDEQSWQALVRDYIVRHSSNTACFVELPLEFLSYIEHVRDDEIDPPFLYELAHFEWLETLISTDERKLPQVVSSGGDLLNGIPVFNPLVLLVRYSYPVHLTALHLTFSEIPEEPTFIVAFRRQNHQFGYRDVNMVTARLVELLSSAEALTGRQLLETLAAEIGAEDSDAIIAGGTDILMRLRDDEIILGCK
jgi:uncharacterized protein